MKIEIKHWATAAVLFSLDIENNSIKLTLEAAVKARASLDGASLRNASLVGASLDGAKYGDFIIKKAPIFIGNLYYSVLIFDAHMKNRMQTPYPQAMEEFYQ